jgi:hypothetical protein
VAEDIRLRINKYGGVGVIKKNKRKNDYNYDVNDSFIND